MKDQNNTFATKLAKAFLSFFYVGYIPKAPGTFGSLATLPLIILLGYANVSLSILVALIIALIIVSGFVAQYAQLIEKKHDPQWIVIDETIGMLTAWAFVFPRTDWLAMLILFCLFRAFDIIKIWPASWFDQKIKHGFGTILDDVISGIMAGIVMLIAKNYY